MLEIRTELLERSETDRVLKLGALTNEHVLMVGAPGTAKSLQAERFFQHFPTAKNFFAQLTKFSTEDVVFGPLDIQKYKEEGKYETVYKSTLLDCHFAYIDEIFDAPDVLLRSMLSVLNERKYQKGAFKVQTPLKMAIGTANYTRLNEITEAVVDRFLFQVEVKPLKDKKALIEFNENFKPNETYNLKQLEALQKDVLHVEFPHKVQKVFVDICVNLNFTDRRILKAVKMLKASAFLQNRDSIGWDNLRDLKYLTPIGGNGADATEEIISKMIDELTIKSEQMELIDMLEKEWYDTTDCGDDDEDEDHLAHESKVLRGLLQINAHDEEVAERRDELYSQFKEHYDANKSRFLRGIGLD